MTKLAAHLVVFCPRSVCLMPISGCIECEHCDIIDHHDCEVDCSYTMEVEA